MCPLVLGSASPSRLELLNSLGIKDVRVHPANIDETPHSREVPRAYVLRLAQEKAKSVFESLPEKMFVLGADTIVSVGRRIFQKAQDEAEARRHITLLSGRRHRVYTGVCLITPSGSMRSRVACTYVSLKSLSPEEIHFFVDSGIWKGVAGYRLESFFDGFVRQINGTHSNVRGLPAYETTQLLVGNGFPLWSQDTAS